MALDPEAILQNAINRLLHSSDGLKDGELSEIVERGMLKSVLRHTDGKIQRASEILGWGRNTVARKSREL